MLLSIKDVALRYGIHRNSVNRRRASGRLPQPIDPNSKRDMRWDSATLDIFDMESLIENITQTWVLFERRNPKINPKVRTFGRMICQLAVDPRVTLNQRHYWAVCLGNCRGPGTKLTPAQIDVLDSHIKTMNRTMTELDLNHGPITGEVPASYEPDPIMVVADINAETIPAAVFVNLMLAWVRETNITADKARQRYCDRVAFYIETLADVAKDSGSVGEARALWLSAKTWESLEFGDDEPSVPKQWERSVRQYFQEWERLNSELKTAVTQPLQN